MLRVVEEIPTLELGHVETFITPGNKSHVKHFYTKSYTVDLTIPYVESCQLDYSLC